MVAIFRVYLAVMAMGLVYQHSANDVGYAGLYVKRVFNESICSNK